MPVNHPMRRLCCGESPSDERPELLEDGLLEGTELVGPPLRNVNFSAVKDTRVNEDVTVQFRAEFFNFFNTPNFAQPNVFFGSPGFGRVLSARDSRELQFGVKLLF